MNFENDFPSAAATARDKVHDAISTARERTGDALARGGQVVQERPYVALFSAFAIGLAVGVILAGRPAPKPRRLTLAESLGDSRERLAELMGTVASHLREPIRKTVSSVSDRATNMIGASLSDALDRVPRKLRWW